ncbi:MAG TPA: hypothetical protein VLF67_02580 [Candidatus Saccharimonas sp.]|nr:hypothetical protein [Candidatus Saccharimonas sp.]
MTTPVKDQDELDRLAEQERQAWAADPEGIRDAYASEEVAKLTEEERTWLDSLLGMSTDERPDALVGYLYKRSPVLNTTGAVIVAIAEWIVSVRQQ